MLSKLFHRKEDASQKSASREAVMPAGGASSDAKRVIEKAAKYIDGDHPVDATMQMFGAKQTRPAYKVVGGQVGRSSYPHIDMKIVSVATCLPSENIAINDNQKIARKAFEAIQHYAALPVVQAFFLASDRLRGGAVAKGSVVPPEQQCRLYAGVENLLLEIYDELPLNGTITDRVVEQKISALINAN